MSRTRYLFLLFFCLAAPLISVEYFTVEEDVDVEFQTPKTKKPPTPVVHNPRLDAVMKKANNLADQRKWDEAIALYRKIIIEDPKYASTHETLYYLGIALFHLQEDDKANQALTNYLKATGNPAHFNEAIRYKFGIAERYREGIRRRLFGTKGLPKWANAHEDALTLYDEVTASLPNDEISAYALYAKGSLLHRMKDYKSSIEAFQTLILRFPKHELAAQAHYSIIAVYQHQAYKEFQNPDFLALAEIQLEQFCEDYPGEQLIEEAEAELSQIREIHAWGMYQTGCFFERTCHPQSAALYFANAINQFPETEVAQKSRKKLAKLVRRFPNLEVPLAKS